MWSTRSKILALVFAGPILLVSSLWLTSNAVQAEESSESETPWWYHCQVVAARGGLICEHFTGAMGDGQSWRLHHPSLWNDEETYLDRSPQRHLFPADYEDPSELEADDDRPGFTDFLEVDDRLYYPVFRDLLEVDRRSGKVLRRLRFPAPISGLDSAEPDALLVTLEVSRSWRDHKKDELILRFDLDGPEPAQLFWGLAIPNFATVRDAEWLVADLDDEDYDEAVRRLEEARQSDPTNPYYAEQLGQWHLSAGDREAAMRAFDDAADSTGAAWKDLIAISGRLDEAGAPEAADRAFENGLRRMEEIGIVKERNYSLLVMTITVMQSRDDDAPLQRAIQAGDADEVHRMSSRIAEAFPYVEGGYSTWLDLAAWMDEQGRPDLAETWRQRAEDNRQMTYPLMDRGAVQSDRAILAIGSITITLILLSLIIGIRGGLTHRRREDAAEDDKDDPKRRFVWIPAVRPRDLVALLVLLASIVFFSSFLNINIIAVGKLAAMPVSAMQDSLAAPEVEEWLETFEESPAQQELLEMARQEQQALVAGEPLPERSSAHHLLADVIYSHARSVQLQSLRQGHLPDPFSTSEISDGQTEPTEKVTSYLPLGISILAAPLTLIGLVFFIFLGSLFGRRVPRIARAVLRFVPGGTPNLAPLGGFVLLATVAALLAIAGYATMLQELAQPALPRYFGLEGLETSHSPRQTWAWLTLAVALTIHILAIRRWQPDDET